MEAARHNTSVSRLVGEMLRERREREQASENAASRFFGRPAVRMRKPDETYPTRESLYDRDILR